MEQQQIVADFWGDKYFDKSFIRAEWQSHPLAVQRLYQLQGGVGRDEWFVRKYLKGAPARKAIAVGVGRGETEISMLERGYVERFDLYDVSVSGLDYAQTTANKLGFGDRVTCHCADINLVDIPENTYDLVVFVASLHHMSDLESILWKLNASLTERGYLFAANEYVGPDRFGYPERDVEVVRAFHRLLPQKFRKHGSPILFLPTAAELEEADPSESPCSSKIIPTIKHMFPRSEIFELYGSFAFILFWSLNYDALYDTQEGATLVRLILEIDKGMVDIAALPGYFAHIVAAKTTAEEETSIRANPLMFEDAAESASSAQRTANFHSDNSLVLEGAEKPAPNIPPVVRKRKSVVERLQNSLRKRMTLLSERNP